MTELKPIKDFFTKNSANPEPNPDHHKLSHHDPKDHGPHHKEQDPHKKKEHKAHDHTHDDEEISLDFSKVKQWFKKGRTKKNKPPKKEVHHKKKDDDDIQLPKISKETKDNFKKFTGFLTKYQVLILLLIPLIISVNIRISPLDLSITDEWAATSINQQIKSQVSNQVIAQYPNLPDSKKNELINEQVDKFIGENRQAYDNQLKQLSDGFKSRYQNDEGVRYLPNIDPYYYARHARSLVEKGHVGDYISEEGIPMNALQTAPIDTPAERHFHMYFMAYLVKFVRFFNSDASFLAIISWVPVIILTLAVIPMFFIAQRYGGPVAGFFAAMILVVNRVLLGRTTIGVADTDAYTITFPLFILWAFLIAFDAKTTKKQIAYALLTGLLLGLFSFAWSGWWYIFDFLLVALGIYLVFILISQRKDLLKNPRNIFFGKEGKSFFTITAILIPSTILFTTLFQAFRSYSYSKGLSLALNAFSAPLSIIRLKQAIRTNLWPNVLTTVAELNPGSLGNVVGGVGGKFMLFIALMGLSFALINIKKMKAEDWLFLLISGIWYGGILKYTSEIMTFIFLLSIPLVVRIGLLIKDERQFDIKYSVLIMLWLIGTIYAVSKGVRFTMLSIPAFALGFGTALGVIYQTAGYIKKYFKIPQWVSKAIFLTIFILLLIQPILAGQQIANREVPIINDAWWVSLEVVKDNTKPDAIITSWWDFGHWFKYIADRPTTFDGASQDRPQAHWVGKAMLTTNELESIGIVRMLDCSSDIGFKRIYNVTHELNAIKASGQKPIPKTGRQTYETMDFLETIDVVNDVLVLDKEQALQVYTDKYGEEYANEFIELTHCDPPEAIYITSGDMIGKSGVWGHFGSWNFSRAAQIDYARKGNRTGFEQVVKLNQPDITNEELTKRFNDVKAVWDSGGANSWIAPWPSYAGSPAGCKVIGEIVKCGNGVEVNLKSMNATITTKTQIGIPRSLVYVEGEEVVEKVFEPEASITVVLIPSADTYTSILIQSPMGASMFNRLFYMNGHGLNYFSKIYDTTGLDGTRIITWKVDWEGKSPIVVDAWVNKTTTDLLSLDDIDEQVEDLDDVPQELEDEDLKEPNTTTSEDETNE